LLSLGVSTLVFVLFAVLEVKAIGLPFGVLGVLATALAIFLAFRNNASFARWGEGSAAWSGILSGTRSFARLVSSIVDSRKGNPQYDTARAGALKHSLLRRHTAWANALRMQLLGQDDWASLQPFLSEADYRDLQTRSNKPYPLRSRGRLARRPTKYEGRWARRRYGWAKNQIPKSQRLCRGVTRRRG
jgi:putative membrane protein